MVSVDPVPEVTTLPWASSTLITGWVLKAAPEAPATGWVEKTSWVAAPAPEGEKLALLTEPPLRVRELSVAVKVYRVPTTPAKVHPVTVTTTPTAVRPLQD